MKFLFDFFPVLLFFITFKLHDDEIQGMIMATAVLMAATFVQVGYTWFRHKRIEKMHIITLVLVGIFGGATIYFRDPSFLIWKVSITNWLFAFVFLISHFIGNKTPLIKRMMQSNITMPAHAWSKLSVSWILFFAVIGVINLLVARYFSFDSWVDFKFYGILGLTFGFVVVQSFYLNKFVTLDELKASQESKQ